MYFGTGSQAALQELSPISEILSASQLFAKWLHAESSKVLKDCLASKMRMHTSTLELILKKIFKQSDW